MFAVLLYHGIDDGTPSARPMSRVDREYVLDQKRFEAHIAYLAAKPAASVHLGPSHRCYSFYLVSAWC